MAEAQEQMNVVEMAEEVYGDCCGPESEYVKLISADGHEFIVERKYALISPVLKNMLNGPGEQLMPYTYTTLRTILLQFLYQAIIMHPSISDV